MTADQRLQFEYMIPTHSLFPEVNFINQAPRQPFYGQNEYSNGQIITTYATTTSNALFSPTEDYSATIQVDTDDVEFAPSADGELTSGCRKCGIDYGSSTELKLHFGAVHSRQTFECCVCNKLFIRRHGFLVHIKRFHEDVTARSFPCPFCEQIYTNTEALNEHCNLQHKEPNPICPLCSSQVPEGGMKLHIEKEHTLVSLNQSQQPPCEIIDTLEPTPLEIKKETNSMTISKPKRKWPLEKMHQCNLCPYETNRAERLRVHVQGVHEEQRAFPCNLCEKSFKQKDKLNRHISSVHLQQRAFCCEYCNMSFSRKDEQLRHVRIVHMGQKPKKKNSSNDKIMILPQQEEDDEDHLLLSTAAAAAAAAITEDFSTHHQCPHCSYHCERSDKLKVHMLNVHSDERPFPCNFCEKRFKLKDKLNMHVNTVHLKRKPFECGFCNQVFGRRDAAKRHERLWCPLRPRTASEVAAAAADKNDIDVCDS